MWGLAGSTGQVMPSLWRSRGPGALAVSDDSECLDSGAPVLRVARARGLEAVKGPTSLVTSNRLAVRFVFRGHGNPNPPQTPPA